MLFRSGQPGCNVGGNHTVTINGNATGGSNGVGILVNSTSANVTLNGTATGGTSAGISVSNGTATITRAKGGPLANSAVGATNVTTGPILNISEIEYGDLGASPTSGPIRLTDQTSNVAVMYRFGTTKKTLVDNTATADFPANSNVRSGVVFANGNRTGTCAVPAASSVVSGVAVDNTTGTAVLTSAAAQSACSSALTAFSSGRLANVATVDSTGAQVAAAFGN